MICTLIGLILAAPLSSKDEAPKGPPPRVDTIVVQPDGMAVIPHTRLVPTPSTRTEKVRVGEQVVDRTMTVLVNVPVTTLVSVDSREVQVYGVDGKKIDPKDVRGLIRGTTPVLVSADDKPVDPFYLRMVKEGTLVLVLPSPRLPMNVPPAPKPDR